MPHYSEQLSGAATAVATVVPVGSIPVQILAANGRRVRSDLHNVGGVAYIGQPSARPARSGSRPGSSYRMRTGRARSTLRAASRPR
jgi:hypothetical protein